MGRIELSAVVSDAPAQSSVFKLLRFGEFHAVGLICRDNMMPGSLILSLLPGPLQAVYYATKAYVTFFSNAIAEELRDTKITVTALLPGATETEFARTSGMDKTELFKKTASARSVAQDGYDAMLAGKLDVISGVTFARRMTLAAIPFTPKKLLLGQVRKMQEVKGLK